MPENSERLRVLLDGKDARTDAIADACARSDRAVDLYAYSTLPIPGLLDKCVDVRVGETLDDPAALVAYAREIKPHLAIIGPEEPLAAGVVNALQDELGVACFGPRSELARIESSKSWARALVDEYGIDANPWHRRFVTTDGLRECLIELGDFVIKPDGLTAGKGVKLSGEHFDSVDEAEQYAIEILNGGSPCLIEEKLDGEEFSLQTITDGESVVHCPAVQDHKRSDVGDTGPNTGGMGSYSCPDHSLPFLAVSDLVEAKHVNEAVIRALRSKTGRPYRGVLYGGFIATRAGVRLIEYNARFGDPEALNVLPLLQTDFVELCVAAATGDLASVQVEFEDRATVCKYVVPDKYPESDGNGDEVIVPEDLYRDPDVRLFWAATRREGNRVLLTGSRALGVVGLGATLHEAEQHAERAANSVSGPVRHRRDIGTASAVARRVEHMRSLRAES